MDLATRPRGETANRSATGTYTFGKMYFPHILTIPVQLGSRDCEIEKAPRAPAEAALLLPSDVLVLLTLAFLDCRRRHAFPAW